MLFRSTYSNIMDINRSFIEASAALESRLFKGKQNVLFFDSMLQTQSQICWYPHEKQIRFKHSLKQSDESLALESLEDLMDSIREKDASLIKYKYICFDIVNMIIKMLNEMRLEILSDDIKEIMLFDSLDELETKLKKLTVRICAHLSKKADKENKLLRNSILSYINNCFKDYNMGLELLADKYNLSISYLSRFFKDQTGYKFLEYITDLRMDEAKRLLAQSNKTINVIVREIGYTNVPSFLRKFKKIEGITPGKYREISHI